jgi:hypothetical protein
VDPLAPLGVFGLTAVATPAGVSAKWNVNGTPDHFVAERTFEGQVESLTLPGALREAVDTEAPDGFVTYKLTPYDAGGLAGGSVRVSLWTSGLTAAGHVTTWVTTPLLNQAGGANPGAIKMAKDYLAEGANGPATEANLLPIPGTTINPEFGGAALSTGCNCDTKYGCSCAPVTFLLAQNQTNGTLDACDYFNCADNVMNYMIAYVTNHTDADLPLRFNYQTDDAVVIMIDNTICLMDHGCCYSATGYGVLPAGEHRLVLKIFEGGGGHNGWIRLLKLDGSVYPAGTITASPYPTMTSVPDALSSGGMTTDGRITDWLIIGQYKQSPGCGPTPAFMAEDFLTEGTGGTQKTEANIVPTAGMLVYTDYAVAASDGCLNGTGTGTIVGATCDPITVLSTYAGGYDNWNDGAWGRVNFSTLFGDQDYVMAYMVCYLTNNTGDYVYVNLGTGSDDSILVKLDNMVVRAVSSCRGYTANQDQGLMVVPPGTHRLMAKPFEGGGGFDGGVFLRSWAGGVLKPGDLSVSLTPPEGFVVPSAPACISGLAAAVDAGGVTLSWTNGDTYDNFVVERKAALVADWTVLEANLAGNATGFVDAAPDTASAAVYYRVTPKILDGTTAVCSQVVGLVAPGYVVYQEGIFPTPAYTGTQDTHIIINTADSNQGSSPLFEEGDWNAPTAYDHKEALLGFEIASLPDGIALEGAALGVFFDSSRNGAYNDHTVYIRQVLKQWNQGTGCCSDGPAALAGEASWNNARAGEEAWEMPGAYGASDITAPVPEVSALFGATSQKWVAFGGEGLAGIIDSWLTAASPNYGLKITQCVDACPRPEAGTSEYINGAYDFCSSEHGDVTRRPILIMNVIQTGGLQRPGDANQDGKLDISDPVWILGHLFLGTYPVLPCDGGTASSPGAGALKLVDFNGDGKIDLSDPVSILNFLFMGGTPPFLGKDCLRIVGCPDLCQ